MAEGMNMCVFSGNLTSDAVVKEVNGTDVARYSVAVNGRKDTEPTYVRCSHWKAGGVAQYLTKGKPVVVAGPIRLATWDKDGEVKSAIELSVRQLTLLPGGKKESEEFATPF